MSDIKPMPGITIDDPHKTPAELVLEKLVDRLDPTNQAKAQKKALRPQNQFHPRISHLNPQGDKDFPRPPCRFDELYIPYKTKPEDLDFEQLELVNLVEPGLYSIERNDGTEIKLEVRIRTNDLTGREEALVFSHPFAYNNENYRQIPALTKILRQMLKDKAKGIRTMKTREEQVAKGKLPISMGA